MKDLREDYRQLMLYYLTACHPNLPPSPSQELRTECKQESTNSHMTSKDKHEFRTWLASRPIDSHLALTLTPTEIVELKRASRLCVSSWR